MEFASFHLQHHQLQEESTQCIASATPPHHYKPSTTTTQSWIPSNNLYNGSTNGLVLTESFTNSREVGPKNNMTDSLRISTEQVFDFHNGKSFTAQQPASEILNRSFSKAMNESCSSISIPSFLSNLGVSGEFPEENVYNIHKLIDEGVAQSKRFNIGDVSSISNLPIPSSSLVSHSLGLNHHQILDLHTSYNNNGSCGLQPCYDAFGLNKNISLTHTNMHCRENSSSSSSNKISSFTITSEVAMTKRPSNCSLPKESEAKAKKSRPSCSPLKVRKEKLGDRIQTLQRLVAPFGKTSTASVLSEAIGYIHFLHQQIQTLSIPYMKSAQSKPSIIMQLDSNKVGSREFKPDLRSRGLCLVPLSYASFIHRCT